MMTKHANQHRRPADIVIGGYAWLSTEHLKLAPGLSRKLAAKFVGPFHVIAAVGASVACFEIRIIRNFEISKYFDGLF